jgi:hypothetical protein
VARSQSSACLFKDNIIFIFGGYNKTAGTLNSIERYDIDQMWITLLEIIMPCPLRRFASVKIANNKVLLLGGVGRLSKESNVVYCFDVDEDDYILDTLDTIDKPGIIDSPVIFDTVGCIHLWIETASGTSPLTRSVYQFLEYS